MISPVWSIAQLQDLRAMLAGPMDAGATLAEVVAAIDHRLAVTPVAPAATPPDTGKRAEPCPSCGRGLLYRCPQTGAMVCGARCGYSRMGGVDG